MVKQSKKRLKGQKLKAGTLKNYILSTLSNQPRERFSPKQILKKLKVNNHLDSVTLAMEELAKDGLITKIKDNKFKHLASAKSSGKSVSGDVQYTGIVDMTRSGAAYIVCEGANTDVFVAAKNLNGAHNGDKVLINSWVPRGRRKPEGRVIKVIERASTHFLGTIRIFKNQAILMVDNAYDTIDIRIPFKDLQGADDGDKAIVKIIDWGKGQEQMLTGKVVTNLGKADSNDVEMNAILINNGFNIEFPVEIIREAEALKAELTDDILKSRRDLRQVTTFTIDPDTAKDFDDALSVRTYKNGNIEVGIHIADVTHFVKPGTALDKEAYRRSTSVYLVDRVAPMLPEKLSNELCSLRPEEDKFTFSAIFEFNPTFQIVGKWFGKTLIHSNRRFTYEEAQEILENRKGDHADELLLLNKIAYHLRTEKFKNGAIAFEAEEVKFELDEKGKPLGIYVKERKDAHMLVEDFMLLANKEVAKFMHDKGGKLEIPFVYRVHDQPDPAKLQDFALFASELGFKMNLSTPEQIAASFNKLAEETKEKEVLKMLEPLAIRTMAKAIYTTENIGHYGLAFDFYTHFTSPIRRYADVLVHRILYENLQQIKKWEKAPLEEQCGHISIQERKAMQAERESIKYKAVEFMKEKIGETFEARISGMIDKGVFVQLKDSLAEGLVLFSDFDESFQLHESRLKAEGLRSGKILKMGDEVKVRLIDADMHRRELEFKILDD